MLKKIIAGVDGREGGTDAAALAAAPAGPDTELLLVGVYPDPLVAFPPTLGYGGFLREEMEATLGDVRAAHAPHARTLAVADSFPARALHHVAEREHADLLVLGSTHRATRGAAGGGRRARQVLHGAPCPVVIAARGVAADPRLPRRIVVAFDGSPESRAALASAVMLVDGDESRITVLSVAEDRLPTTMMPLGAPIGLDRWDEVVDARREYARELVAEASAEGRRATEVRVGYPPDELAAAARGADLLVLGSRRWGALQRLVIGTTAEELLRGAPCSLLLVPRPADAETTSPTDAADAGPVEEHVH